MIVVVLSIVIVGIVIAGMSIGVIMGREPIKGSCGGLGAAGIDQKCELCGGDTQKCEEVNKDTIEKKNASNISYDATKK